MSKFCDINDKILLGEQQMKRPKMANENII